MRALIRARLFQYDSRLKRQHDRRPEPTMFARFCMNARRRTCKVATLVAWLILLASVSAGAQEPPPKSATKPAELSAAVRAKNVESFEVVWKTIRDKHFDPKLGGLDWQAVHDTLRPKVEAAKTMSDARAVLTEAIAKLHQTHFGIIPSDLYSRLENPDEGPGEIGIDIRLLNGRAVVSTVAEGGPAMRAGVKTGWVVDKIEGKPVSELLKTAAAAFAQHRSGAGVSDTGRQLATSPGSWVQARH